LIQAQLKDEDKINQALMNVKSRKADIRKQIKLQEEENRNLQKRYDELTEKHSNITEKLSIISSSRHSSQGKNVIEEDEKLDSCMKSIKNSISILHTVKEAKETSETNEQEEKIIYTQDSQETKSIQNAILVAKNSFEEAVKILQAKHDMWKDLKDLQAGIEI
jgi:predicted nuclease with TOPRIM domain